MKPFTLGCMFPIPHGVEAADLGSIAAAAAKKNNPVALSENEIRTVLKNSL